MAAFEELYEKILKIAPSLTPEENSLVLGFIKTKVIELSRVSFYMYVKYMAPVILPDEFIDGRHIKLICSEFQKIEEATHSKTPKRLRYLLASRWHEVNLC